MDEKKRRLYLKTFGVIHYLPKNSPLLAQTETTVYIQGNLTGPLFVFVDSEIASVYFFKSLLFATGLKREQITIISFTKKGLLNDMPIQEMPLALCLEKLKKKAIAWCFLDNEMKQKNKVMNEVTQVVNSLPLHHYLGTPNDKKNLYKMLNQVTGWLNEKI